MFSIYSWDSCCGSGRKKRRKENKRERREGKKRAKPTLQLLQHPLDRARAAPARHRHVKEILVLAARGSRSRSRSGSGSSSGGSGGDVGHCVLCSVSSVEVFEVYYCRRSRSSSRRRNSVVARRGPKLLSQVAVGSKCAAAGRRDGWWRDGSFEVRLRRDDNPPGG